MKVNLKTYYIFCPANHATGGPEALHQLGQRLIQLGFNVFMYYYSIGNEGNVHEDYKHYNVPFTSEIVKTTVNVLIIPETHLSPIYDSKYDKMEKIIWWLSVTNYQIIVDQLKSIAKRKTLYPLKSLLNPNKYPPIPTLASLKKRGVKNIAHSYFSLDFLEKNGMEIKGKISDYMSDAFYNRINNQVKKEDVILYNPIKNGPFLEEIIQNNQTLNWKPLINMSPDEVATWMNKSKLYIDFGYHPGQERMPREAILTGCCVITGSKGSAAFQKDVPLPKGFKFDEDADPKEMISKAILRCLNEFDQIIPLFESYRQQITGEKEAFMHAVKEVFVNNNSTNWIQ